MGSRAPNGLTMMTHTPDDSALSASERATLLAVGQAVLPGGATIPRFSSDSAGRVAGYMAEEGPAALRGIRAFLHTVDAASRLRHGHAAASAGDDAIRGILHRLDTLGWPTRMLVKLGLAPIKVMHLDDPAIFESLGLRHRPAAASRETDRRRDQQVFDGDSLEGEHELEADVVVVGTGAGGAVIAAELARAGHEVLMLEAGRFLKRDEFTRMSRPQVSRAAYRPMQETLAVGNTVIPVFVGRSVGGTTTVNSGTCFRTPDDVLEGWATDLGLDALSPREMSPHFDAVEEVLGVGPAQAEWLGGVARVVARGADRLGLAHGPLDRNAPGCDGQSLCCFGCPTDAKRSTNVSYVPRALDAGALLVTGAEVHRVLVRSGVAYGVAARVARSDGTTVPLTVRASRVVLACGTLYTPPLMMGSRVGGSSGHLGRHLAIHPATSCYALMDEQVDGHLAIPQGYSIDEFRHEGVLFEGAYTPLELMAMDLPGMGAELVRLLERYRQLACFGLMIKDGANGRVLRGPGGRPRIVYRLGGPEVARLRRGMETLIEVFLAAGAISVHAPVRGQGPIVDQAGLRRFRDSRPGARDFELTAFHPLGSARMAARAADGVVDTNHEVFGTPHLHVVDGAVVPSSLGVNPQITIMALAHRAAARISDLLRTSSSAPWGRP